MKKPTKLEREIDAFQRGELINDQIIDLFAKMIRNGLIWHFDGHYGKRAKALIDQGYIDPQGNVLSYT